MKILFRYVHMVCFWVRKPTGAHQTLSRSIHLGGSAINRMIPAHCADVGVKETDIPLTEEGLRRYFIGRMSYSRTKFYVLKNGEEWAVVKVAKEKRTNLFSPITEMKVLSLPDRTEFVGRPDLDVLDIGGLLRIQAEHPGKLVIVQGRFEHVSFVDVPLPAKIGLIDVVPPEPSKLETLIGQLVGDESEIIDLRTKKIDLSHIVQDIPPEDLIFLPCRVTDREMRDVCSGREALFLDKSPDVDGSRLSSSHLIGCSLSSRIFKELYSFEPRLHNICPRGFCESEEIGLPTIARCCKVKSGVQVDGDTVFLPWGANLCEVSEALRIALGKLQA